MLGSLVAHRYRLLAELGRGGLGAAYRARDEALDRDVCLKVLREDGGSAASSLRTEFELLRGLVHPHLARVHDFGVAHMDGAVPFFTSDIARGVALQVFAQDRSWREVVRALAGPLVALAFLHRRGIRHGDVKPENILVSEEGAGTLIDLSCASRIGVTRTDISGTPGFIAPELMRGERGDARADLFSVGKLLERLTKHPPLSRLIDRLSAEDPADRPASVDEVLELLGLEREARDVRAPTTASLFGRDAVLSDWARSLDALHARVAAPRVVVIAGRRGAGKSRLLRELVWAAELRSATVEGFAAMPGGVRSMLERAVGASLPPGMMGAVAARDALLSRGVPIVLAIDDASSLGEERALLDAFARLVEPTDPVLLVMTETPAFSSAPAEGLRHELGPLDGSALDRWLREAGLSHAIDPIFSATGGWPASVQRAVDLLARGAPLVDLARELRNRADGSRSGDPFVLPSEPRAAAAIGLVALSRAPIDVTELAEMTGADLDRVDALAIGEGGMVLASHVEREAVLAALDAVTIAGHEGVLADRAQGAMISERGPRRAERAAMALHHLVGAGRIDAARALYDAEAELRAAFPRPWLEPGARLAAATASPTVIDAVARDCLRAGDPRRALAVVGEGTSLEAACAARLRAEALLELGDASGAVAAAREAARAASPALLLEARGVEARALVRLGNHAEALELATRSIEEAPPEASLRELWECAAAAAMFAEDYATAREHVARAAALPATDPRKAVRTWSYAAIIAYRAGDTETALARYQDALAAAEASGLADQIPRTTLNLGTACHQRGDLTRAQAAYERGEKLAVAIGQEDLLLVLGFNSAKLHADGGALDRADAKASRVMAEAQAKGAAFFVAAAESVRADVALCRGQLDAAEAGFARARRGFASQSAHREVCEEDLELARAALARGAFDDARAHVATARSWDGFAGATDLVARASLVEARLAMAEGDAAGSRRALARASSLAARAHAPELEARALAQLADVCSAQGLPGEAREVGERARAIWERMTSGLDAAARAAFWKRPERAAIAAISTPIVTPPAASVALVDARVSKLERLLEAFRRLNTSLETADVLAMAMDEAITLTGAERGFVVLVREDGAFDIPVARNVDRASLDTTHLAFSRSIAERAIETATLVLSVDARRDERFRENVSVHAMQLRSVIAAPIRSPDGVLGALYLDNRYGPSRFDDGDTELLLAFADQVAIALRNARLVATLRKRQEELDAERRGQAEEIDRLNEEVRLRQEVLEHRFDYSAIVGRAPALRRVFSVLDRVIDSPLSVLVTGESGTGKELVARAVHFGSSRKGGPFVGINCAALPAALLETELFGHAKGAFTGADRERAGLVVTASGGTLFLDELGEMSLDVQAKLLRVLQEREVRPVGATHSIAVDFRLVCATNRDLRREVAAGRFREDLYYRVGVVEVSLPPLRERLGDIPELALRFAKRAAEQLGRPVPRITPGAMKKLTQHVWPGNIRELENVITKAVVLADDDEVRGSDVDISRGDDAGGTKRGRAGAVPSERAAILKALEGTKWNAVNAAKQLGMPRATFYRRLRALGIERPA